MRVQLTSRSGVTLTSRKFLKTTASAAQSTPSAPWIVSKRSSPVIPKTSLTIANVPVKPARSSGNHRATRTLKVMINIYQFTALSAVPESAAREGDVR